MVVTKKRSRNPFAHPRRSTALALLALLFACSSPEVSIESVREMHAEQRFVESIVPLEALLDENPGNRELNQLYGLALWGTGHASLAIWPLARAAESPDATLEDHVLLARAQLEGGSAQDAIAAADRVLEESPNVMEALQVRIDANRSLKKYEESLADVEQVLEWEPEHGPSLISRAELLLLLERPDEAEAAISDLKRRLVALGKPNADPNQLPWTGRLCAVDATFLFERREDDYIDRARRAWEDCLDQFPKHPIVVTEGIGFFDAQREPERGTAILRRALEEAPTHVGFKVSLAQRLVTMGENEEAERLLVEAAESPGGGQAAVILIDYYEDRGQLDQARVTFERKKGRVPNLSPREQLYYADLLIRLRDYEAAQKAIARIQEPEYRTLLEGRILLETGKPKQALTRLDEAIRNWPGNSVARQLAAEAAEQLGYFDRVLAEYKEAVRSDLKNLEAFDKLTAYHRAMGMTDTIVQIASRYTHDFPDDPRGHRRMIEIARWSGRPALATQSVQQLGRLPGHFEEAVAAGAALRMSVNPTKSAVYIEKHTIDLTAPSGAAVLAVLVESLSELERHDDAMTKANAALVAYPDFAQFSEIQASALEAAGHSKHEVRAALSRAIELDPERVSALSALARLTAEAGQLETAIALYDRATAAAGAGLATAVPAEPEAAWAAIELLVANELDDDIDRRALALLKMHPYHADAALLLARRMAQRGDDLNRARSFAQRALLFGGGPKARATLGWIQLELGETQAAIDHLRASLEQGKLNSSFAHYQLARALVRSGEPKAARDEYEKALADETFSEAEAARAELAKLGL